ncbi:MAG UNVERIFIED_CONTAM: hypothetical protein LVR29_09475 [Microcystis novacekii LVE1205-3]
MAAAMTATEQPSALASSIASFSALAAVAGCRSNSTGFCLLCRNSACRSPPLPKFLRHSGPH